MRSCDSDKFPGYDGFNMGFVKKMWSIIGCNVVDQVHNFFCTGRFPKNLNTTLVSLIPKVNCPTSIEDMRSVSMVGCIYKIISKILARRIKNVLGSVNSENRSGFSK